MQLRNWQQLVDYKWSAGVYSMSGRLVAQSRSLLLVRPLYSVAKKTRVRTLKVSVLVLGVGDL